jgi:(1->4)-alpha-D-glucan 1-alpha-D-glucosylmutase
VDWSPPEPRLKDLILLPILADRYGRVLDAGDLSLARIGARFQVTYHDRMLPVAPPTLAPLIAAAAAGCGNVELAAIGHALAAPPPDAGAESATLRRLDHLLASVPECAHAIDEEIQAVNGDADSMDVLLDAQHYRLAYWRAAEEDLGYRRFFDIDGLVGVRIEHDHVFDATHERILKLVDEHCVDGLRIDHIDGLRHPGDYVRALRRAAPSAWVVVEKILEGEERLPADWPTAGTTGYEFLNLLLGLFVDPASETAFDATYRKATEETATWAEIAQQAKLLVIRGLLGADVARLTQRLLDVCERRRRYRDFTRGQLRAGIEAVLAAMPVYRTYVDPPSGVVPEHDARIIREAIREAGTHHPEVDPDVLALIGAVWRLRLRGAAETEFVATLQQVSGPVMAKGVEDTAFYRYHRFVALNEVGGDPSRFGISVARFHAANEAATREEPRRMVTTSTHDTKRSEDVRARLAVLSEHPEAWQRAVPAWEALHERGRRQIDARTAYAFHQNLVGAWPISPARMSGYMLKLAREAKERTSWVDPDETYEEDLARFVEDALDDDVFTASVGRFVADLEPAASVTALAQKLLCLTVPGVPDVYQGSEVWHRRLVDPDNRRPIDYQGLRGMLARSQKSELALPGDGSAKLHVVATALRLRRARPDLLGPGAAYTSLSTSGTHSERVVAFLRGGGAAVVAPRLVAAVGGRWADTAVDLPNGRWRNVLDGTTIRGGAVEMSQLVDRFPVALLVEDET